MSYHIGGRLKLLVLYLVLGVGLAGNLLAQRGPDILTPQLLAPAFGIRDEIPRYNQRIVALCGALGTQGALLKEEGTLADHGPTADARVLISLACVRARLSALETISRPGFLMPLGDSWTAGSERALLRGLALAPSAFGAEILGALAYDAELSPLLDSVAVALAGAVGPGTASAAAARSCVDLSERGGKPARAAACAQAALAAGVDSTWQQLYLARAAARTADTTQALLRLHEALHSAHDRGSWDEVGWQLKWFVEPDEWDEWQTLPDSSRQRWVLNTFALRDIRDARPSGSRLVEHFARLDYVIAHFRLAVSRKGQLKFLYPATPESRVPGNFAMFWEPGLIHADLLRPTERWTGFYDDRATVWMRLGAPGNTREWSGIDTVRPSLKKQQLEYFGTNSRTVWQYDIGGSRLLLQFEPEAFTATTKPTRLVKGVLGSYLCGLDTYRCFLTTTSENAERMGGRAVEAEHLERIRTEDAAFIKLATTQDDNSRRFAHGLETSARLQREWKDGRLVAVIPWSVRAGDLLVDSSSVATLMIELRQWDENAERWIDTTELRRLRIPAGTGPDARVNGLIEAATGAAISSWSLMIRQDSIRAGGRWGTRMPSLVAGTLEMSDLILGAPKQRQVWTGPSGKVPVASLGTFNRKEPVSLYWQILSEARRAEVETTIALYLTEKPSDKPSLEVRSTGSLEASLNESLRELDISRLDKGAYRLEVVVRDRKAGVTLRRTVPLLLR
ncbi:MAG: hypothetical protein V4558_01270 [Gemmatimonadota bacterium]